MMKRSSRDRGEFDGMNAFLLLLVMSILYVLGSVLIDISVDIKRIAD